MLNLTKINTHFNTLGKLILRFRILNIIIFILLVAGTVTGLKHIKTNVSTEKWFLEDDQLTKTRKTFEKIFGNNDFIAVHITNKDIFQPKVLKKIRSLGKELFEKVPYSDEIISLTDFEFSFATESGIEIKNLIPKKIPHSKADLEKLRSIALGKKNLVGKFISKDSKETWIILRMKPFPKNWQKDYKENPDYLVGRTAMKIVRQNKYRLLNPKTTGMPIINTEKQSYLSNETPKLLIISIALTILILAFSLRSFRGILFPFITVISSILIVFGIQGWLNIEFDPMVITMPIYLGLATAIGYSIHIFTHFKQHFIRYGKRKNAIIFAIEETGWPILFTALTTMIALLTLQLVPVRPLRWIGLTTASIIIVEYLITIIIIPSLLSFGKDRIVTKDNQKETQNKYLTKFLLKINQITYTKPKIIIIITLIITTVSIVGITQFEASFDVEKTFGRNIKYVNRILEVGNSKIGSLYSYSLGLEFKNPQAAKNPKNLKKFEILINEIKRYPLTKKISSLLDVIKDMNQTLNKGKELFYTIPGTREMVAQLLLLYENAGGSEAERWVDYDYQRLHLMVEVSNYNSNEMKKELQLIQKQCKKLFPDAKLMLIGSIAQFTIMMDYVIWGQIFSFLLALVLISILLMIVFGSIKIGLIAMIPNITPALLVGGVMGFLGIPLDMISATIMPMLLGLAVDDTIHFINHTQLEHERSGDYVVSIKKVFRTIGVALMMTSMVLILNFSAYLVSNANIYQNMGILVSLGILAALFSDCFIVPVLIRYFKPFKNRNREVL